MNILHISSNYYPEIGGLATSVPPLSKELIKRGHKAVVLTRDAKGFPSFQILDGIPVYRSFRVPGYFYNPPVALAKSIAMGLKARKIIEKEKIEMIHSHDINVSAIAGIIGTKFKDVKKVTKFPGPLSWELLSLTRWRDITLEEFFESGSFWISFLEKIQKIICNQYDAIIAPSEYIKKVLVKYGGIESSKIHVIFNGITVEPYLELQVSKIRKMLLGDSKYLIISACRMVPWKGIEYLIEAFKRLPKEYRLVLIGDGPVKEKLQSRARGLNVVFLDKMLHRDVQTYMRASDAYVMPSIYENFPLAVLDCLATQTPIVATNVGGTQEMITNSKNGLLIEPKNVQALVEGIQKLISDKELYNKIKENQKNAYRNYVWENIIKEYIKVYENLKFK